MCKLAEMPKLMPPLDSMDFSSPKTYIICWGYCRKIPTKCILEKLPEMKIDRKGKLPNLECPDLDLPKMENGHFSLMERTGVIGTK